MHLRKIIAVSTAMSIATFGVALAQTPGLYVIHSKAAGGCPALDWHVAVEPTTGGNNLSGVIGWDDMKHIARVTGTLNPNTRTFEMSAKEVGGQERTATINGQLRLDGFMTANITGPGVNCTNVTIPYYVPPTGGGQ